MVDKNTRTYSLFNGSPMVDVLHKLDEKVSKLTDKEVVSIIEQDTYGMKFTYTFLYDQNPRAYVSIFFNEISCMSDSIERTIEHCSIILAKRINQS